MTRREFLPVLAAPLLVPRLTHANTPQWPQWRGPNRDGVSTETGLLSSWPGDGPKVLWTASNLGSGYGSMAIADGRIYLQGSRNRESVVWCLDLNGGKAIWHAPLGPAMDQDRGPGPRGTPTVDGDRIYVLSENGTLACVRAKDAHLAWHKNILRDFGGRNPKWLLSESPLVDGEKLVFCPGGSGTGMVAVDKMSGRDVWTAKELSDTAGYSSIVAADIDGVRTYMTLTANAGVGVRASDGKLMWRYERVANRVANCTTPIYSQNKVFYTSAYDTGCALLNLKAQDGAVRADEAYFSRDMMNHHGGVVLVNGYLYGFSNAILTCMEFATGKVAWRNRSVGKGALTYADGKLFLLGEGSVAGLAKASPDGYEELGRFNIPDSGLPSWAHPVVCGGKLYIRNQGTLTCYDVRG